MKTNSLRVFATCFGLAVPLFAQDLGLPTGAEVTRVLSPDRMPGEQRALSAVGEDGSVLLGGGVPVPTPGASTLSSGGAASSVDVLEEPSGFRALARDGRVDEVRDEASRLAPGLEKVSAAYREPGTAESDCRRVGLSIEQQADQGSGKLLETVETEIEANSGCACEIVKSAIRACEAETEQVVAIVETAILAAPDRMRIISQCAIAAAPDSLSAVQALVARYDTHAGEEGSGAKSAKDSKDSKIVIEADSVAATSNPLDFPGEGPVGPQPGMPGGEALIPIYPPLLITPPVIVTPPVSEVDP